MSQLFASSQSLVKTLAQRAESVDAMLGLLKQYGMLPQLLREVLIDDAIASVELTPEETFQACQQFYQQHQLKTENDVQSWLAKQSMTRKQLESLMTRSFRLARYKQETWGHRLEPYFLERKASLDRVIYSLLRVQDIGTAQEIYFRIQEGEQPFEQLARTHSQGVEAETGGLLGPVELSVPHPTIAKLLRSSKPGQLLPPTRLGEWVVIVRLEKFLPAQLDAAMKQRLLDELFERWIQSQLA